MDNFHVALAKAQASEHLVADYLEKIGCTEIQFNQDYRYDLSYLRNGIFETAEVKHDLLYATTGNVVIEIMSRGKASGITRSLADVWYYVLGDDIYEAKRPDILLFLIQHYDRSRKVNGGDNRTSLVCVIPYHHFCDVFKKVKQ